MANEQQKYLNRTRLWGLTTLGMALGIWEMVEESATSLSPMIGKQVLEMAEKQLGLEVAGEKPEDVLTELARIFIDEFGYAVDSKVERADKTISISFKNAVGTSEFNLLKQAGAEKLFCHPYMCAGLAVLSRMGIKARWDVTIDVATGSQTVTYELL